MPAYTPDTLSVAALKVLTQVKIPNNGSASSLQAITDIKQYMNRRAKSVWSRRVWREYVIEGTLSLSANQTAIALSSITADSGFGTNANGYNGTFYEVCSIRNGSFTLLPEDIGAINKVDPSMWGQNSPIRFYSRGQNGLRLLGAGYQTAQTLNAWGKAAFQDMTDNETWCLGNTDCLIDGATADFYRNWWEDEEKAQIYEQKFSDAIRLLVDAQEVQGAAKRRIVPTLDIGTSGSSIDFTSKTGASQ